MPDVLLLELDGVLFDLSAPRRDLLRHELATAGIRLDEGELRELAATHGFASAMRTALARAARPLDPTELDLSVLRAERALETRLASGASLVPGALGVLEAAQGVTRLALATAAPRRRVDAALALAGLVDRFEAVVTGDDLLDPPPAPELYERTLERLARRRAVARPRTLALVGTADGIRAARAAGVRVVAVGELPPHAAVEADGHLHTLDDVSLAGLDQLAHIDARVP